MMERVEQSVAPKATLATNNPWIVVYGVVLLIISE